MYLSVLGKMYSSLPNYPILNLVKPRDTRRGKVYTTVEKPCFNTSKLPWNYAAARCIYSEYE